MNILTMIVLLILAVFALNGYIRGFVKTLASMVLFLLATVLVYYATPYVSGFLRTETPLYRTACDRSAEFLQEWIEKQESDELQEDALGQEQLIEELPLPGIFKKQLMNVDPGVAVRPVAESLAALFVNIVSYILTFAAVTAALHTAVAALDIMARLPLLRGANRMFGLLLGLMQGVGALWIAFLVLTIFGHTDLGGRLMEMVEQSPILSMLYKRNIFLRLLFGMK